MSKNYKILLVCAGGFSTSMLVKKMMEVSNNNHKIWADGIANIQNEAKKADCILIGPQIRFKLDEVVAIAKENGIKAEAVDMIAYGTMNAEKVLNQAYSLIEG